MIKMFAHICLFTPPYRTYTYLLPSIFPADFWKLGQRVIVPVGHAFRCGCIVGLSSACELKDGVKYREIYWPLEIRPLIRADLLEVARELAKRHGVEVGGIFANILPSGLKEAKFRLLHYNEGKKSIMDAGKLLKLNSEKKKAIIEAIIAGSAKFIEGAYDLAEREICSVCCQPPWPIRPAAKKQLEIMEFLHSRGTIPRKAIMSHFGSGCRDALDKLIDRKLVKTEIADTQFEMQKCPGTESTVLELSQEQKSVLDNLLLKADSKSPETCLLYGITGSGKTVVYFELAKKYLSRGQSVLLLAPEVALAHKLYNDARFHFGSFQPVLYHGYQPAILREKTFREIGASNFPHLVIGTRSALFLPIPELGCIIMDEEHDSSYKQDERLPYHAKEVASFRISLDNGLLVLGSATPDIRSFYAAEQGYFPVYRLARRVTGISLPEIELNSINISAGIGDNPQASSLLSPVCEEALRECIKKNEQAIILLNRRGYAPLIFCLKCAKTIRCPHCDIGMTFHKGIRKLVCHYCGYSLAWPAPCPECGETSFIPIGEGTEKYAERLEAIAGAPVLRLDRDCARGSGQIENILASFAKGNSPFLVGTQMLSKGHHFPNVTLVVVADGDIGLNMPDYRAGERTFQLLTQAAGRAGRGEKPGRAIIQTRNADHYCWQHILHHDYEGFYKSEIALRKKYCYPPFIRLGMLRLSYAVNEPDGMEAIRSLAEFLKKKAAEQGVKLLGPAPAPLPMLNNRKRFQCLMKCANWEPMRQIWYGAHNRSESKILRILLDLDPVNMM